MTAPDDLLPTPESVGESRDHPSAIHGDFHHRPDFAGSAEVFRDDTAPLLMGLLSSVPIGEHGRMPGVRFARPRSFSTGRPLGPPRFIVIHYTAGSEGPTAAEDGVAYDQRRTDGTSAHFYTDRDSIIQCVDCDDRSHTAKYYGNGLGINIEQCGTQQTRAQWLDAASRATIRNTAKVCAWAMTQYGIPLTRLVARQIRTGKGIGGHKDVTLGFPEDNGSHMDPDGSLPGSYPYDLLFADIREFLAGGSPAEEDAMSLKDEFTVTDPKIGVWPVGTKVSVERALQVMANRAQGASERAAKIEAQVQALLAAAGEDVERDAEVRTELANVRTELAAVRSRVEQIEAGDPIVLADILGDRLTEDMLSALEQIRLTRAT